MALKFSVDDLTGVVVVPPTPALDGASDPGAAGTVDLQESERMIRALVRDGVDGILTNGTLGEMASLTLDEWKAFAEVVAETVRDAAPDLPLFVGATGFNTRDTLERARHLQRLGVRGMFLGRPMWNALGADAMLGYYHDVAAAFPDIAIVLYDNPEAFKGPIPVPVYAQLARHPSFVGAKYPSLGPKARADFEVVGDGLRLLPLESDWLAAHALYPDAATGCWSSSAACGPEPALHLRDALRAGDLDEARWVTHRIEWTYETFLARSDFAEFSRYNIAIEKLRFDEAGYVHAGPARAPYHVVPDAYEAGARENGRRWRALVAEVAERRHLTVR
jgi:dihydrodipicolinate synthase/N-acetylneuraminate lyase